MFFTRNRFYPQNFILQNCTDADALMIAQQLAEEAVRIAPERFNGTEPLFSFQLRYCPPYESFRELKRLQTEAIYHTHFKDEYRGLILLDLSEWADHADEEYFFRITLPFLADMSSEWHYIFFFNKALPFLPVISELSDVFWCRDLSDRVQTFREKKSVCDALQKEGVTFCGRAVALSRKLFGPVPAHSDKASLIIRDFTAYFGKPCVVDGDALIGYLHDDTYMHALLEENRAEAQEKCEKESA